MNELQAIKILDTCLNKTNKISNKITNVLENQKQKQAYKYFENNAYIKEYVNKFYSVTEYDSNIIENDMLRRVMDFDFTKIPETLHENLKEYMQDNYCMYYYDDNYNKGFSLDSFDNIYISYENEIFADFSRKSYNFSDELDKFVKIELLMHEHGIYPDIVELGYYGEYYADYNMPDEYKFLKTGMKENEKKLVNALNDIKDIYDKKVYNYYDNRITDKFTPEFIFKLNQNDIDAELDEVTLDADFNLTLVFYIPMKLRAEGLDKLNVQYGYSDYDATYITINTNIKEYLQEVIK